MTPQYYRVRVESLTTFRTWTVANQLTRDEAHDMVKDHRRRFPDDRAWVERDRQQPKEDQ